MPRHKSVFEIAEFSYHFNAYINQLLRNSYRSIDTDHMPVKCPAVLNIWGHKKEYLYFYSIVHTEKTHILKRALPLYVDNTTAADSRATQIEKAPAVIY